MKQVNIQGDREFQGLSEYLLTFRKDYHLRYDSPKILTKKMVKKNKFGNVILRLATFNLLYYFEVEE